VRKNKRVIHPTDSLVKKSPAPRLNARRDGHANLALRRLAKDDGRGEVVA
jgi:hypothetical protein